MLIILLRVLEFNILINAPICKCASVTTSVTLLLDLTSSKALWKPAFSMLVLFFPTALLSSVSIAMIFLLSFSIMEYVQYLAQWPGLSIRPSPFREKWVYIHTYTHSSNHQIKKKNCWFINKPQQQTYQEELRLYPQALPESCEDVHPIFLQSQEQDRCVAYE